MWFTSIYFQEQMYFSVWDSFKCVSVCVFCRSNRKIKRDIYAMKETRSKTAHFEWVKTTNKKNIWFQWMPKATPTTPPPLPPPPIKNDFCIKMYDWKKVFTINFMTTNLCAYTRIFWREREREGEREMAFKVCVCVRPLPTQCISKLDLVRNRKNWDRTKRK